MGIICLKMHASGNALLASTLMLKIKHAIDVPPTAVLVSAPRSTSALAAISVPRKIIHSAWQLAQSIDTRTSTDHAIGAMRHASTAMAQPNSNAYSATTHTTYTNRNATHSALQPHTWQSHGLGNASSARGDAPHAHRPHRASCASVAST